MLVGNPRSPAQKKRARIAPDAMTVNPRISPTHRAIQRYYEQIQALRDQHVDNEMNVRAPFEFLLAETGRQRGWTLVPELSEKAVNGLVRPDGTLRDLNSLPRGYWEAKDTKDDFDLEIQRKIARGYRTSNTIFEDTEHAVLYQNNERVLQINIGNPLELVDLLNKFYSFTEPDIQGFEAAIDQFGSGCRS